MGSRTRRSGRGRRRWASLLVAIGCGGCTDNAPPGTTAPTPACVQILEACRDAGATEGAARDCYATASDPSTTATACFARTEACLAACAPADAAVDAERDAASDAERDAASDGGGDARGEDAAVDVSDATVVDDAAADASDAQGPDAAVDDAGD